MSQTPAAARHTVVFDCTASAGQAAPDPVQFSGMSHTSPRLEGRHTVVAGSKAEQAGLRTGDEVTAPVVLDDVLTNPDAQLTLKVRRGTDAMEITYLPRGAAVSGYRWTRVAGVPDSACAM